MSAQQKKTPFDFKTQYGLGFNPQDDEIVVDFFCGGGGAGTGLEMGLGRTVNVAKNHSPQAISMHTVNHPGAKHFTTDVFEGDPDTECGGKAVGWFHMSPDCTHHSQAAGGQPRKREIRNLSWIGLKWGGKKRPRVISLENVKQILQWGRLIAKRDKATGRVVKLGGDVAAPGEVVPVGQQFLIPDPKQRGRTKRPGVNMPDHPRYGIHSTNDGLDAMRQPVPQTIDLPMPAGRVRSDGSVAPVEDSPYELGMYYGTIGLPESDNPFARDEKMSRKLFSKGWQDSKK